MTMVYLGEAIEGTVTTRNAHARHAVFLNPRQQDVRYIDTACGISIPVFDARYGFSTRLQATCKRCIKAVDSKIVRFP